jgi:hypothetical protein
MAQPDVWVLGGYQSDFMWPYMFVLDAFDRARADTAATLNIGGSTTTVVSLVVTAG